MHCLLTESVDTLVDTVSEKALQNEGIYKDERTEPT